MDAQNPINLRLELSIYKSKEIAATTPTTTGTKNFLIIILRSQYLVVRDAGAARSETERLDMQAPYVTVSTLVWVLVERCVG
jgi:hypothetical protein